MTTIPAGMHPRWSKACAVWEDGQRRRQSLIPEKPGAMHWSRKKARRRWYLPCLFHFLLPTPEELLLSVNAKDPTPESSVDLSTEVQSIALGHLGCLCQQGMSQMKCLKHTKKSFWSTSLPKGFVCNRYHDFFTRKVASPSSCFQTLKSKKGWDILASSTLHKCLVMRLISSNKVFATELIKKSSLCRTYFFTIND